MGLSPLLLALLLPLLAAPRDTEPAARAAALLAREEALLDGLDALDARIASVAAEQASLVARAGALNDALATVERRQADIAARKAEHEDRLAATLRARRRFEAAGARLRVLLAADDPTTLVRHRAYLRRLVGDDLKALRAVHADAALLEALKGQRGEALAALAANRDALAARRAELEVERQVKAEVVRGLRGERRLLERLEAERATRRAQVTEVLPAEPAPAPTGIAAARGALPWPVPGRLIAGFGPHTDPEHGTQTQSSGWRIDAPVGTPVRSIHGGRVVYSGWYKGFGNLVIVDHGTGHFSLYAHLAAISKARGEVVEAGAVLGEVGDTGSLHGPQLYFELRQGRTPVDPAAWLRRR